MSLYFFCIVKLVQHDRPTHGQSKKKQQPKKRETRYNLEVTFSPKSPLPSFLISSSLLTFFSPFFLSLTWGALHCPLMLRKRKKGGRMKKRRSSIPLGLDCFISQQTHVQTHNTHTHRESQLVCSQKSWTEHQMWCDYYWIKIILRVCACMLMDTHVFKCVCVRVRAEPCVNVRNPVEDSINPSKELHRPYFSFFSSSSSSFQTLYHALFLHETSFRVLASIGRSHLRIAVGSGCKIACHIWWFQTAYYLIQNTTEQQKPFKNGLKMLIWTLIMDRMDPCCVFHLSSTSCLLSLSG